MKTRILTIMICFLFAASCSFVPKRVKPIEESEISTSFRNGESAMFSKEDVSPIKWWESFNNAELNALVDKVIENNLDLQLALSRVDMMESQFKVARGTRLPSVSTTGSYTKQEGPVASPTGNVSIQESELYSLRTGLRFELDIWGRLRANHKAAIESFRASKSDLQTAYIGIISQAIISYFDVQAQMLEVEISSKNLRTEQHNFKVNENRYKMGIIDKSAYDNSREMLNNAELKKESDVQVLENLKNQLAVLLGEYPQIAEIQVSSDHESYLDFSEFPSSIPSEVLKSRSDIISASHSMESARHSAGAAFADLFPSISITAVANFASLNLDDLFKEINLTESITGEGSQVWFAGGSKISNYKMKKAQYDQAVLNYKKTVLNAFMDVENSLKSIQVAEMNKRFAFENYTAAKFAYEMAVEKYELGVISYAQMLNSERKMLSLASQNNSAQRNLVAAKVQLHSSLGGNWLE